MIYETIQRGYWEELSLWWILPTMGYVLLLSGFYLVLKTTSEILRRRTELPTYPSAYQL